MPDCPFRLRPTLPAWPARRLAVASSLLAALAGPALATCLDEDRMAPPAAAAPATPAPETIASQPQPRLVLRQLVGDALSRSYAIGAARLLAEAAENDTEEAQAARRPQASITGSASPSTGFNRAGGASATSTQLELRAGVSLSQTLYDGGRTDRIVDWRRQQAEAAKLGLLSQQEQITLTTTSLAFERSRFRMQAVIYAQNVRKMGCLVQALETIVNADRGRMSELVQARKQLQQAELQQVQAQSQARQVEARLRRVVGDGLPGADGMATLMLAVPELPQVLAAAERSVEISQLEANARALKQIARVVEAGNKPQVSWNVGAAAQLAAGGGSGRGGALSAGVTISVPLLNPAIEYSSQAARKRAEAAELQRAEALEQRRQRIVEVHEQAQSAFERVKRVSLVLHDSERLRNFTLQQWQQMGRRSLFDVIAAESDHYNLRIQYVNALHDGQQMNATLTSLGTGLSQWLQ